MRILQSLRTFTNYPVHNPQSSISSVRMWYERLLITRFTVILWHYTSLYLIIFVIIYKFTNSDMKTIRLPTCYHCGARWYDRFWWFRLTYYHCCWHITVNEGFYFNSASLQCNLLTYVLGKFLPKHSCDKSREVLNTRDPTTVNTVKTVIEYNIILSFT